MTVSVILRDAAIEKLARLTAEADSRILDDYWERLTDADRETERVNARALLADLGLVAIDPALVEAVRTTCGDTTEERLALANHVLAQLGVT
jgi:hypothetical protein